MKPVGGHLQKLGAVAVLMGNVTRAEAAELEALRQSWEDPCPLKSDEKGDILLFFLLGDGKVPGTFFLYFV